MKKGKRILVVALSMAMALQAPALSMGQVEAASKKVALSSKNITLEAGQRKILKIKNAKKKVKWTIASGKGKIALVKKKKSSVVIVAKKKGTAKVKAAVGKNKYICKVTIKAKKAEQVEQAEKNQSDVSKLKAIIAEQKKIDPNCFISEDLDSNQYKWNTEGRLVEIDWKYNHTYFKYSKLKGNISFEGFDALECVDCYGNALTGIDISKCTALRSLSCGYNNITGLDVTKCIVLDSLECEGNNLTGLDVTNCQALTFLACGENQLTGLDVRKCTSLKKLYCYSNAITSLDVSNCQKLTDLNCYANAITNLDLSQCTVLDSLTCDEAVVVTGYSGNIRHIQDYICK